MLSPGTLKLIAALRRACAKSAERIDGLQAAIAISHRDRAEWRRLRVATDRLYRQKTNALLRGLRRQRFPRVRRLSAHAN